jgi:hypothetical protein
MMEAGTVETVELTGWNDVQPEPLQELAERLRPLYRRLAEHRLYRSFRSVADLRVFMEAHVFAVWDFMSLLKTLQRGLTCVDVPWVPSEFPLSRRLVNEIVLGEESDLYAGRPASHFELYLMAMRQAGASTSAIDGLISGLRDGVGIEGALGRVAVPEIAAAFVRTTFACIGSGKLHAVAAAFTFGREDLIPDMFQSFIRDQDEAMAGGAALVHGAAYRGGWRRAWADGAADDRGVVRSGCGSLAGSGEGGGRGFAGTDWALGWDCGCDRDAAGKSIVNWTKRRLPASHAG